MNEEITFEEVKVKGRKSLSKALSLIVLCGLTLMVVDLIFESLVKKYAPAFMDYKVYINAVIILGLGYVIVNSVAEVVYWLSRVKADHSVASLCRILTRIMGVAVLLATLTSAFNVNPSAALTVGSFTGMVIGFATQTILGQAVAGIFLVLMRPFKPGDKVTVAGQTGIVKGIGVMHTVLVKEDGSMEIMIPSSSIVTAIIWKTVELKEKG